MKLIYLETQDASSINIENDGNFNRFNKYNDNSVILDDLMTVCCNICGFEIEEETEGIYYCPICDNFTYFS